MHCLLTLMPASEHEPPLLQAQALCKHYRLGAEQIDALREVSFSLQAGEFVAVMGPSGSGKSSLLHILGLLDYADSGEVWLAGQATRGLDDDSLTALRRERLGFVFQQFELLPNLSAAENILLPAEVAGRAAQARQRLPELASRLGIAERLTHLPQQLSGGQQQRVAIARAIINQPLVILADEPTGNLDSRSGHEVLTLLREGVDNQGWTVVMVTHDPSAALYADRILFLQDGQLSGEVRSNDEEARATIQRFVGV